MTVVIVLTAGLVLAQAETVQEGVTPLSSPFHNDPTHGGIGVCLSRWLGVETGNSLTCSSGFIPAEKVIENELNKYAEWLAKDRAGQARIIMQNTESQARAIDSLSSRVRTLEEQVRKLQNR
jgi:hypothetical protein